MKLRTAPLLFLLCMLWGANPYVQYETLFLTKGKIEKKLSGLARIINENPYFYHPYLSLVNLTVYRNMNLPSFRPGTFQYNYFYYLYYKEKGDAKSKTFLKKIKKVPFNPFILASLMEEGWSPHKGNCVGCGRKEIEMIKSTVGKLPPLDQVLRLYGRYRNSQIPEVNLFFSYWAVNSLLINRKPDDAMKILKEYEKMRSIKFDSYLLYYLYHFYSAVEKRPEERLKYALLARDEAGKYGLIRYYYLFHRMVGVAYGKIGEFNKALQCFNEAFSFYKKYGKKKGLEEVLTARGFLYYENGLYENARKDFQEVMNLIGSRTSYRKAYAISLLALIEGKLGDYKKTEKLALKGIEEAKKSSFPIAYYSSKLALARAKIGQGNLYEAINLLRIMLESGKKSGDRNVIFSSLSGLIEAYEKANEFEKVLEYAKEAIKLSSSPRDIMKYNYIAYKALKQIYSSSYPGMFYFAFAGYPYIKKAYSMASSMKVDELPSREERYQFLKSKFDIFSDYAKATKLFIYSLVFVIVVLVLVVYFTIAIIRRHKRRKASIIGPFQIEEKIGGGGMASVFRARDIRTGDKVALKVIERKIADPAVTRKFIEEGKILRKLNHSNIVKFIESGEHQGILYLAMEFLEGKDLNRLSKETDEFPFPLDVNLKIAEQVLKALVYIHKNSVLHRDVKPSNIMVLGGLKTIKKGLEDGSIKLMDFGIAKQIEVEIYTTTGEIFGTPYYMPPEMLKNGKMDHRGDIYSFGVMLYWLVTGKIPFYHPRISRIVYKILNEYPEKPSQISTVPAWIDEIIMKCIRKDKEERFQSAEEILQAINKHI